MSAYLLRVLSGVLSLSTVLAVDCTPEAFAALVTNSDAATVNYASPVAQGGSFGVPSLAFPLNATDLPALCAVGINVKSSANSSFNFALFLPDQSWNERFLATGNGGYGGGINW
jgi:feruloyl esterase